MKYRAVISSDEAGAYDLLKPEIDRQSNPRSATRILKKEGKVIIEIDANDATALRAGVDSVVQMLRVYEKMSEAK